MFFPPTKLEVLHIYQTFSYIPIFTVLKGLAKSQAPRSWYVLRPLENSASLTCAMSTHTSHTHTSGHRPLPPPFSTAANLLNCRRRQGEHIWHGHHRDDFGLSHYLPAPFVFATVRSQRHWFKSAPLGLKRAHKLPPAEIFKRDSTVWWKKKND